MCCTEYKTDYHLKHAWTHLTTFCVCVCVGGGGGGVALRRGGERIKMKLKQTIIRQEAKRHLNGGPMMTQN